MPNKNLTSLIGSEINSYTITKYINSGAFGDVFEARDNKNNINVALKIPIQTEEKNGQKWLLEEAKIYKHLLQKNEDNEEPIGITNVKMINSKKLDLKIMVMDLLGPSIESLIQKRKKFRLPSIILLAIQMIKIVRFLHLRGYVHRDLKPDNFVLDYENMDKLYCIDFGLAKKYVNNKNNHVEMTTKHKFCGTARYASISAHLGYTQSRKDDLESIGYILVYLFNGKLPWQHIKHSDKEKKYQMILRKKQDISEQELTKGLPREFLVYFKYVKELDFDEKPHYTSLINMFVKLYQTKKYNNNYEWKEE